MERMSRPSRKNKRFNFPAGRFIAGKYQIEENLGSGWEGEVYRIVERSTGIRRAAKFYYPHRDPTGKAAIAYARKLDALRHCPILLQYHHQETAYVHRRKVIVVISELVEGKKLSEFLHAQSGHRLSTFEALHVLYVLAKGIAPIHDRKGCSEPAGGFLGGGGRKIELFAPAKSGEGNNSRRKGFADPGAVF